MKTRNKIIIVFTVLFVCCTLNIAIAQPPPSGPATGAPIDGISGLIALILSAIFGKRFFKKDDK